LFSSETGPNPAILLLGCTSVFPPLILWIVPNKSRFCLYPFHHPHNSRVPVSTLFFIPIIGPPPVPSPSLPLPSLSFVLSVFGGLARHLFFPYGSPSMKWFLPPYPRPRDPRVCARVSIAPPFTNPVGHVFSLSPDVTLNFFFFVYRRSDHLPPLPQRGSLKSCLTETDFHSNFLSG